MDGGEGMYEKVSITRRGRDGEGESGACGRGLRGGRNDIKVGRVGQGRDAEGE